MDFLFLMENSILKISGSVDVKITPDFCTSVAGRNKCVGWKYFLNFISKQAENLRAGWKKNLKNLSKHANLLGTSEYLAVNRAQLA